MAIQNHFMNISLIDNPLKITHSDSITLLVLGKSDDHRILNEKKKTSLWVSNNIYGRHSELTPIIDTARKYIWLVVFKKRALFQIKASPDLDLLDNFTTIGPRIQKTKRCLVFVICFNKKL